jgi:hypothetical protein
MFAIKNIVLKLSLEDLYFYEFCNQFTFKEEQLLKSILRIGEKYGGFITLKEIESMTLNEYCVLYNAIVKNHEEDVNKLNVK